MKDKSLLIILILFLVGCDETGTPGLNSITNLSDEAAGDNCSFGGVRIDSGVDSNNNGTLEALEIQSTSYVCNGSNGLLGLTNLVDVEPGALCSSGGIEIQVGVDINGNEVLDIEEVQSSQLLCDESPDKEIRFDFSLVSNPSSSAEGIIFTDQTSGYILNETQSIRDFNIENFSNIDSVSFSAFLITFDPNVRCFAELYNLTDDEIIVGTEISTNENGSFTLVETTTNFLDSFPKKTIDLSIRIRSEQDMSPVQMTNPIFFMYRGD